MHWLKNLFKKTEVKQTKKVYFDEIENVLSEETNDKKSEIESKAERFRQNFINYFELLIEDFGELLNSKFEPVILEDKRDISNIVLTSRNNYCSSSKKVVGNAIEVLKREKSLEKMNFAVSEVFNKLNGLSREAQILLNSFQNQMKKISTDLRKIKNEIDRFESFLDKDYLIINLEKRAKEQIEKIKRNRENKKRKETEKKEIEGKIKELEKEIETQKSAILEVENSNEALKLRDLEKEQALFKRQLESIVSEIDYLVNSISRQVRKYIYTKKIDKQEKSKIINFLENPENLLKEDYHIFEKTIKDAKKNIKNIESDEKKRKKFLLIENKITDSLKNSSVEYRKILEKDEKNLKKIENLKQKINTEKLKYELEKLNNQMQQLKENKKEVEKEIEYDEKEELKKLEILLSKIFDTEVEIK